jgi:hypothetical protein
MKFRMTGLALAWACCASLVFAQQPLKLQITAGRVTLHAQNVPVRTILAEWARVGGAKIVNGERITSPPVTLDFENVSERQALDILLRGVSGYMLAARAPGAPGASMYDRIMILPTSAAPAASVPARAAAAVFNAPPVATIRPGIQRAPGTEADESQDDNNDGVPLARPVTIPRPVNVPPGMPIAPPIIPGAPVVPEPDQQPATPPAVVTTPSNPFGLPAGSSSRPGVVAPAPQTQPQQQPRNAQDR